MVTTAIRPNRLVGPRAAWLIGAVSLVLLALTALAVAGALGLHVDPTFPMLPESPGAPDLRLTYA